MKTKHLETASLVTLLVSIITPNVQADNWPAATVRQHGEQEFAVWPAIEDQEAPDIYGNIIVWQQYVTVENGDYDIYIADINNPRLRGGELAPAEAGADPLLFIIGDSNDQMNPAIYDKTIVWQDYVLWQGFADWDIRAVDISDQNNPHVFVVSDIPDNDEQFPAIAVIWQDSSVDSPVRIDIYGADITDQNNPMEFPIANYEFDQQSPAIYRTTVVWQDNFFGDWDIFAADIWQRNKPSEFPVSFLEHEQQNPAISGNTVIWQDNFSGNWDIYAADISEPSSPVEFVATINDSSQTNPDIDGNIIVWQDYRNGNWDIFGYNLITKQEFQITDDPADQTNPAISANVVVWQDNRNGSWNIYAVILDGPEIAN
jgi:beta propeller repeat protein